MKKKLLIGRFWYELFIMSFCMFIAAIGIHFFLVPGKLIIGSLSGLAIVISTLSGIRFSFITFMLNAVFLVLGYSLIGREFGLKTVYTALILSPWLYLLEKFVPVSQSIMQDTWFDLLCFVVIISFVQALLFRINASTGGLDIFAKIINKYLHVDIGTAVIFAGGAVCCSAFFIHGFRMVFIGLLGTWINGLALNYFSAGLNTKKRVCIISKESDRIKDYIIHEIQRGVTLYEVTGGYSVEKMVEVVAILGNDEFARLMKFINDNNIRIFMTAGNVNELYGLWHKADKRNKQRLEQLH